ncbi:unnamed protein product [Prunus armeniaca]
MAKWYGLWRNLGWAIEASEIRGCHLKSGPSWDLVPSCRQGIHELGIRLSQPLPFGKGGLGAFVRPWWVCTASARLSFQGGVESAIDSGEVGLSSLCHWGGLARSWSRSGTGCRSFGKVSAVSTISAELGFGSWAIRLLRQVPGQVLAILVWARGLGSSQVVLVDVRSFGKLSRSWADRVSPFPSERCLPFGKQRFEGALSTLVELGTRLGSRSIAELLGLAFGEFRNLRLLRQVPGVEAPVLRSWVPGKIVDAAWHWVFAGFELGGVGKVIWHCDFRELSARVELGFVRVVSTRGRAPWLILKRDVELVELEL